MIARAQEGDREALNELIAGYWSPVYRLLSYKTGNLEDAQELTQETFFRAFNSLARYKSTGATFKAYLDRIAINLANDFWRKRARTPAMVDIADYQGGVGETELPEAQAVDNETRAAIESVLLELPDEQRIVVELRIINGLPVRQVAIAMEKTEPAIKMLQQRALKNLRKLLLERKVIESSGWR